MRSSALPVLFPLVLALPLAVACSGESQAPVGSIGSELTGPVEMRVTDTAAAAAALKPPAATAPLKVVVTITRIDARVGIHANGDEGGWTTVFSGTKTIDLMSLKSGTFASLGVTKLLAGDSEQLRLVVSDAGPNYVTTSDSATHPLVVPSGDESGIKVFGDFDAATCATGHVTMDFDLTVLPPSEGRTDWMLVPVIRLGEILVGCERGPDRR